MSIKKITRIAFVFIVLINWGCGQSGDQKTKVNEQIPQKEQVNTPTPQKTPSGELDRFGRKPGDQHYGHNHASNENSNQKIDPIPKPASGEPDKYGRKPGDQHYGHNHQ